MGVDALLPIVMRTALADVFGVSLALIDGVRIVEHSRFARLHGRHVAATTRKGVIHLAGSQTRFIADPELVLHEYFHVLRQWNAGALTSSRYVLELLQHGYRGNRYELEARAFARRHVPAFAQRLRTVDDATA